MSAGAGTSGMTASTALQVGRRSAVTAVAVSTTVSSPAGSVCDTSTSQCWVERLVRIGRASMRKAPSASAAAKFAVNDTGSPSRSGWSITALSAWAALRPPKGPTMFQ